jgi:hypothetical protein
MAVPKVISASEPISTLIEVVNPVKTKNVAGTQINPATEDTLWLVKKNTDEEYAILVDLNSKIPPSLAKEDGNLLSLLARFIPIPKASLTGASKLLNADLITDLVPFYTPCLFRTMVMLDTSGVFSVMLKNGGTVKTLLLNGGTALIASAAYMFDILVGAGDTVNFQTGASGNVTLRVQEIMAGVQ